MTKGSRMYTIIHNIIAMLITMVATFVMTKNATPDIMLNAILWSIIIGFAYRMMFNVKVMNFYVGSLFTTATIFIFDLWYIPFIYILSQSIYRFSCLVVSDGSRTGKRPLKREIFIVLNMVICGFISAIARIYFVDVVDISTFGELFAMIVVCLIESAVGLIFIYIDLKQQEKISSIVRSIASHLQDAYGLYIVYILMTINVTVMYVDYSYIGLIVASSFIFTLHFAFEKQAKVTQIKEESFTDILTGVKNKKYYIEFLPEEFSNSCAIFFIDFNGFKRINDKYGHDIGDEVIVLGGEILSNAVREKDDVIRFGGDEFMLLIKDADREVCKGVIKRIQTLCKEKTYKNNELELKVSMSIGIAICPEESNIKDELATIADEKMYKAKKKKGSDLVTYEL